MPRLFRSVSFRTLQSLMAAAAMLSIAPAALAQPATPSGPPATSAVAFLDGVWIGPAAMTLPDGQTVRFEQMERVGPMMGGEIRVMEGKGRDSSGKTIFNAFTIFSQRSDKGIEMRSYAMGHENSRKLEIQDNNGFAWEFQAGAHKIRYTAEVTDGIWSEKGERIGPDGVSVQFFEMKLKRVGDTTWPAENPTFPTH
jgi:hypothetical protein